MKRATILVVQHDESVFSLLQEYLVRHEFDVLYKSPLQPLTTLLANKHVDLVIVGPFHSAPSDVLEVTQAIQQQNEHVPIIIITGCSSEKQILTALKLGVSDFFTLPLACEELCASITRILAKQHGNGTRKIPDSACETMWTAMIGKTPQICELKTQLMNIAPTESTVLIIGETGTGKELAAEMIHQHSRRKNQPFVSVNCAALPETLIESELFGYERGAFTGAVAQQPGKFEQASGGTILLDEIGDMAYQAQAKILRTLEQREIYRLGSRKSIPIDVRVIAATNHDLEQLMRKNVFRNDLFYRLNVAQIVLPPLRDRKEDIPLLLDHFLHVMNQHFGRQVQRFSDETIDMLLAYDWPGNIRELKNLVEASFINLPPTSVAEITLPTPFIQRFQLAQQSPQKERDQILTALFATNWNKSRAAQKLHWSRMSLYRKMEKYQISLSSPTNPTTNTDS
ncbi:transcriptional regulatory protein zraR [Candidatus Vecturithrix granuli]|uniref:Transcriptional regulatory protein zraR n=1 Tax=Vecturithrix granuli TaxID=1499967 RepID=A0A0S6W715_VECG1|nr:transcriptional regulatory protein zraR [Candidatus Vecturithrix granuli]